LPEDSETEVLCVAHELQPAVGWRVTCWATPSTRRVSVLAEPVPFAYRRASVWEPVVDVVTANVVVAVPLLPSV